MLYRGFKNPIVAIVFGLIVAAIAISLFVWLYYIYMPSLLNG